MTRNSINIESVEFIMGNSNKRFSGVTSTMLQVLPHIDACGGVAILGHEHVPKGFQTLSFIDAACLLRKSLPDNRWRVFHARRNDEMIQALILKHVFRCKIKVVFTSTAQRKKSWLTRLLMRKMDGLVSTCRAAAEFMSHPPDVIIPHGISAVFNRKADTDIVSRLVLPAKHNIGLFGRVRSQKGVDLLIDASCLVLPEFPDWGVVFVGEITSEQNIFFKRQRDKLLAAGLSERVIFTGERPFEELPAYFQSVDIVCALSLNEGFGLTVLEGAMCSKPVIATKAGAWPDILGQAELGFLIDVGDLGALVGSLRQLMMNPELREKLGNEGAVLVRERYTVEREAESLVSFYRLIAERE